MNSTPWTPTAYLRWEGNCLMQKWLRSLTEHKPYNGNAFDLRPVTRTETEWRPVESRE